MHSCLQVCKWGFHIRTLWNVFLHIHIHWLLRTDVPRRGRASLIHPTLLIRRKNVSPARYCLNKSMRVLWRPRHNTFALFTSIANCWECVWGSALCPACRAPGILQHCFKGCGTKGALGFNAWDLLLSPWDTCWDFSYLIGTICYHKAPEQLLMLKHEMDARRAVRGVLLQETLIKVMLTAIPTDNDLKMYQWLSVIPR